MRNCHKFVLAWSVRERILLAYVKKKLLPSYGGALNDGSMQYQFWVTENTPPLDPNLPRLMRTTWTKLHWTKPIVLAQAHGRRHSFGIV